MAAYFAGSKGRKGCYWSERLYEKENGVPWSGLIELFAHPFIHHNLLWLVYLGCYWLGDGLFLILHFFISSDNIENGSVAPLFSSIVSDQWLKLHIPPISLQLYPTLRYIMKKKVSLWDIPRLVFEIILAIIFGLKLSSLRSSVIFSSR